MKYAVQLYTLRRDYEDAEGFLSLFKEVKALGFDGVEFAGWCDLDPAVVKKALDEAGLVAVGCHCPMSSFDTDEKIYEAIKVAKTFGMDTYGVGGAPHSTAEDIENLRNIYRRANEIGEKEGIKFYYHNHSDEFKVEIDGELAQDLIAKDAYLEVDTYWSFHAGVDNYKYITENKDRIVHLHIKDGIDGKPKALGEGNGTVVESLKAAKDIGLEWVILENDDPVPTGLEDIARSMEFFKKNA